MKFLFRPVSPWRIFQNFGENMACIPKSSRNGQDVILCDGHNPPIGYKSVYSKMNGHNGLDLQAKRGQAILSSQDGWVEEVSTEEARGLGLGIITKNKHFCNETGKEEYFKIRYWHNMANLVKKGDEVSIGQLIALADNTGYSSGDHLHFEIKPVTVTFKDGKPKFVKNILQDNGYYGAVDPLPYLLEQDASLLSGLKTKVQRLIAILKLLK